MPELQELSAIASELLLALAGISLLVWGVFRGGKKSRLLGNLVILVFGIAMILEIFIESPPAIALSGLFIDNAYTAFVKTLVLFASALTLIFYFDYQDQAKNEQIEYPILVLFSTLGMMMMISAHDFLSLYMGIELQSLCLYVLASIQRDNARATEAGLKYFVLGALSSGILLYGISLIYGFGGSTSFAVLQTGLATSEMAGNLGIAFGLVLVIAGLAFKISAAPFHMWTPDVYEGAPTPVTAFFAVAPKIAAMALVLRVLYSPFEGMEAAWSHIIIFLSVLSVIIGSFAALNQTNIKRLMAYSSIGHIGFALLGVAAGTQAGIAAVLLYMTIYLFMTVGVFGVILCMRRQGRLTERIEDLAGLSKSHPLLAGVMALFMFSLSGIPPLAGFFGKFAVFTAALEAELYIPTLVAVVMSVVAAYYYLRIVKLMYFDELSQPFDRLISRDMEIILGVSGLFALLFFAYPAPVLNSTMQAAQAIFAG